MHKTTLAILSLLFLVTACKDKKGGLSGDEPITAKELLAVYPVIKLPYTVADTSVNRLKDTTTLPYKALSQFVPDSVLEKLEGGSKAKAKTRIHPLGRIEKENGNYLLTTFTYNKHTSLAAFFLDQKNNYKASLELLPAKRNSDYTYTVGINREPTFTLNREKLTSADQLFYTRTGYAYIESSGDFLTVINETNEEQKKVNEIYNPVDTLGRRNKFSGDYVEDKKNFISVRDGRNAQEYLFFIHFEKNNGTCTGELKGEFTVNANGKAVYKQNGDPCVIDFAFTNTRITVKEQGSCGNHRGIRCLFNDSYDKKREKKKK